MTNKNQGYISERKKSLIPRHARISIIFLLGTWASFALLPQVSGQSTDFATERLSKIIEQENALYEILKNDSHSFHESDLERRFGEIKGRYRSFLSDNPEDHLAWILYGKLLRRAGEDEQAFKAFLKADELSPQNAVVKQQIGTYLAETGKGAAALTFYLQAVELEPQESVYHFGLGQLLNEYRTELVEKGIYTNDTVDREMLRAFEKALLLQPKDFDLAMRYGAAFHDLSVPNWEKAIVFWRKLEQNERDATRLQLIWLQQAHAYAKLGQKEIARSHLKKITIPALIESKKQVDELL